MSVLCVTAAMLCGGPFSEYQVTQGARCLAPDLDEFGGLVWQQWYEDTTYADWDIYLCDLNTTDAAIPVVTWPGNQQHPAVWKDRVIFEDEYADDDHDIYVKDIVSGLDPNAIAATGSDDRAPVMHGNTAAWQRLYVGAAPGESDWDILIADITELGEPAIYWAASFVGNQEAAAIYRSIVAWQDDYYGDWDITSTDVWLKDDPREQPIVLEEGQQEQPAIWKNRVVWTRELPDKTHDIMAADISDPANPVIFALTDNASDQLNPDIYEHIAVWQDNRNGHWDIYGYNFITRRSFRITDDPADQTAPTIGGGFVAWTDLRGGAEAIWAAHLDGAAAASCDFPPAGDLDGNCRVNLADVLELSEGWLACGLEPISACQ